MNYRTLRAPAAEFIGTMLFVLVGAGSVVANVSGPAGALGIALAHGIGLAVLGVRVPEPLCQRALTHGRVSSVSAAPGIGRAPRSVNMVLHALMEIYTATPQRLHSRGSAQQRSRQDKAGGSEKAMSGETAGAGPVRQQLSEAERHERFVADAEGAFFYWAGQPGV